MKKEYELAEILWNYHVLGQPLKRADLLWVLCSNHLIWARFAADLYKRGYAKKILYSGGVAHTTDLLHTGWNRPESHVFAEVGVQMGIPSEATLIEDKAQNTGENIRFCFDIIKTLTPDISSVLLVQKPFMERRVYATLLKQWPGKMLDFSITSPPFSMGDYIQEEHVAFDDLVNVMVGDLQRIKQYPAKGFQTEQDIPIEVWDVWERLVEFGYNKHLVA